MLLVAAGLALVVPLSGCVTFFLPPEPARTSQPTDEKVDDALAP